MAGAPLSSTKRESTDNKDRKAESGQAEEEEEEERGQKHLKKVDAHVHFPSNMETTDIRYVKIQKGKIRSIDTYIPTVNRGRRGGRCVWRTAAFLLSGNILLQTNLRLRSVNPLTPMFHDLQWHIGASILSCTRIT